MVRTSLLRWWGPCVVVALGLSVSPSATGSEKISVADELATLSGCVYADINNSGDRNSYACGFYECGIAGVEIVLQGIEELGDLVRLTALTDKNGDYLFADLAPGHYSVTETQPLKFIDAQPRKPGSAGGLAMDCDRFTEIYLGAGVSAVGYDFGEWGLNAKYISKADLVVPEPSTFASLAATLLALVAFVRFRRRS